MFLSIYIDYIFLKREIGETTVFSSILNCFGVVGVFLSIIIDYCVKIRKKNHKIKKRLVSIYKMVVARVCYLDPERSIKPPTIFGLSYVTTRVATSFPYRMVTGE